MGVKTIEIESIVKLSRMCLSLLCAARMRLWSFLSVSLETLKLAGWWINMLLILVSVVLGLLWHGIIGASLFVLMSQSWLWFLMAKEHIRKQRIRKTEGWEVEKERSQAALKYLQETKNV